MNKLHTLLFSALVLFSAGAGAQSTEASSSSYYPTRYIIKGQFGGFRKLGSMDPAVNGTGLEPLANDFRAGTVWAIDLGVRVAANQYVGLTHSKISQAGNFDLRGPGGGIISSGRLEETIRYTGVNYSYRLPLGREGHSELYSTAGVGLWNYSLRASSGANTERFSESNIGFQLGAGYELRLSQLLGLFAEANLLAGDVKVENEKENLTHLRYALGIAIRL
jgi:opacity protein-like surface antigen